MSRSKYILYCNTCGFVDVRNRYRKCPFCNKKLICILRHTAAVGAVVQRPLCGLSSGRN